MNTIIVIAIAAVAAIAAWAITWFLLNNRNAKILGAKDSLLSEKDNQIHQKEMLLQAKESDLQASRATTRTLGTLFPFLSPESLTW